MYCKAPWADDKGVGLVVTGWYSVGQVVCPKCPMLLRTLLILLIAVHPVLQAAERLTPSHTAGTLGEVLLVAPQGAPGFAALATALETQLPEYGWQVRRIDALPETAPDPDSVWLVEGATAGSLASRMAEQSWLTPQALVLIGGYQTGEPALGQFLVDLPSAVLDVVSDWDHPLALADRLDRKRQAKRSNKTNYRQWRSYLNYHEGEDHDELVSRIHGWLKRQLRASTGIR